jgi:hypothetical protein
MLETFPQKHQPGPVPGQNLQAVRSLRTEDKNRSRERIMAELLASATRPSVRKSTGFVATMIFTPADAAIMLLPSRPVALRAAILGRPRPPREPPPISMVIIVELRVAASATVPAGRSSVTTGTKSGASSAGRLSKPARAALRQTNRCCGEIPCGRATSDTTRQAHTTLPRSAL